MAFVPTNEQQQILRATERILIVQACPGSGKTTLFAHKIYKLLANWQHPRKGIAAISFTNSASQEIYSRVGTALQAPHFIGTLDSFVLRNVVLPFGHFLNLPREGAKLVPSPLDERLLYPKIKFGNDAKELIPVYSLRMVGGEIDFPIMEFTNPNSHKSELLKDRWREEAIYTKKKCWASSGIVTHSDTHYIAAALLTKHHAADLFLETLTKRYPTILVDELQDTMTFLSKSLLALLNRECVNGMVVGDEDQSIYTFGGASANIFQSARLLTDAKPYSMSVTQRFGSKLSAIASHLSTSGATILSAKEPPGTESLLLIHNQNYNELSAAFGQSVVNQNGKAGSTIILCRNKNMCQALTGGTETNGFPGTSKAPKHILRAVLAFRMNDNKQAFNIISRELWYFLAEKDSLPTKAELTDLNLTLRQWRVLVYRLLVAADEYRINETWGQWQTRVKETFEKTLKDQNVTKKLGSHFKAGKPLDAIRPPYSPRNEKCATHKIMTIHQAKGAEFDNVIVIYGKPHASNHPCISTQWWNSQELEETRIGFVALTRAKTTLTLCIHERSFAALKEIQPEFIEKFDQVKHIQKI